MTIKIYLSAKPVIMATLLVVASTVFRAGAQINTPVSHKASSNPIVPGITNPNDFNTCFDPMGQIAFTSKQLYSASDSANNHLNTFEIPLVGDLDGDGYPEIVAIGITANTTNASMNKIHIYDGRSGRQLSGIQLPFSFKINSDYHGSPSYMALVNTGKMPALAQGESKHAELIIATSDSPTDSYKNTVTSFFFIKKQDGTYRLEQNWTQKYIRDNDSIRFGYSKPIPQIADIDGDGKAEVIVYNKIFDARDGGAPKMIIGGASSLTGNALSSVHVGRDYLNIPTWNRDYDGYINFSQIYDMDFDGIYDYVAGGQIYYAIDFTNSNRPYTFSSMAGVPDGRTAVADINGDNIPDVVVAKRTGSSQIRIVVWNPDLLVSGPSNHVIPNPSTPVPYLLADMNIPLEISTYGSNSYIYIGDIDGRVQTIGNQTYRLPEIALLSGKFNYASSTIERHPNLSGTTGIPIQDITAGRDGDLIAFTWDADTRVANLDKKLKLSFALEHADNSGNTGFTLFDFDNDGIQEICYKDKVNLRIIKGNTPYIKQGDTHLNRPGVIVFSQKITSETGYEYPVIADINNDASAEIVVLGKNWGASYNGFLKVMATNGDKFAPAWPVWNQFMYSPFKINPDLTVPKPENRITNPLQYKYARKIIQPDHSIDTIQLYQPFNGNIFQATQHIEIPDEKGNPDLRFYEPISFLTEAYIAGSQETEDKRPRIVTTGNNSHIELTIGNRPTAETDISLTIPLTVYTDSVGKGRWLKRVELGSLYKTDNSRVTEGVAAGKEIRVKIPVTDPDAVYYVRLGDDSEQVNGTTPVWRFGTNHGNGPAGDAANPPEDAGKGIGIVRRAFRDCNWNDQSVRVSSFSVNVDAATVQKNGSVLIDLFGNDMLPLNFFSANPAFLQDTIITKKAKAGTVIWAGDGKDKNTKLIYTNNGTASLANNIDTIEYTLTYYPGAGAKKTLSANIYIYILESASGTFAACYGKPYTANLKAVPTGVAFYWFNAGGSELTGNPTSSRNLGNVNGRQTYQYQIRPVLTMNNAGKVVFPKGDLKIEVAGINGIPSVMKWNGSVGTDWHDVRNWVEVKTNGEVSASFVPAACVDVIIPSGLENYPQLTSEAVCNKITMKDRAMIGDIDSLTYTHVEVELTLKPSERDRFVMWSPPLQDMYTGDYHFTKTAGGTDYYWGDVSMNFFQVANPDAIHWTPHKDMFTATFGNIWTKLLPGQAFNLKVIATADNQSQSFIFPRTNPQYKDTNGKFGIGGRVETFTRPTNARFMSDAVKDAGNMIPVRGDWANPGNPAGSADYIQVVNPYMAYLRIRDFLNANSAVIENQYKIWSGEVSKSGQSVAGDVVTVLPDKTDGSRYLIDNLALVSVNPGDMGVIAPLQSFFVKKRVAAVHSLEMRSLWTTTVAPGKNSAYELKADVKETNTLRVTATWGKTSSAAILCFRREASPHYDGGEDAHKLFYADAPVAVYSFSPANDPLAINT
ncbi:MAG: hypothetical protein LBH58_00875, partial [Tannerellaceae bacterium]|nr:hypothetical protein [Tannerellaceae bacterium]